MLKLFRIGLFKRNHQSDEQVTPTEFIEKNVPPEIAVNFNVKYSFAPADGRDFRILYDGKKWGVFPWRKLSKADESGVVTHLFPLVAERERVESAE